MAPPTEAASQRINLSVTVASGDRLDIRTFSVGERISSLFRVELVTVSDNHAIDFDAVVGQPARFTIQSEEHPRFWSGICNHIEQVRVEEGGLSTYALTLVPHLWLATQRRNYRIFQQITEPDIALRILNEWGIEPEVRLTGTFKKRKIRVQYAESDYAFLCRMLEDAGVSFYFVQTDGDTALVLSDAPHLNEPREQKIPFKDDVSTVTGEYVTRVRIGQNVRPGRYTMRDHDYRKSSNAQPLATAEAANVNVEKRLERYHYTPGAFLFGSDKGESTPVADDRGKVRVDEAEAALLVKKRLDAKRSNAKECVFETNALDLAPGMVMRMQDHPRPDLGPERKLLVIGMAHSGSSSEAFSHTCEARSADAAFRPPLVTPKPKVIGVESATVVGPTGEEIHTDEFGRVRVHFHWDRESRMDETSSCWIHVSQPWSGAGFGGVNLPRVGQEVLVEFLGGDPDRPIVVGRVYTNLQKVPYKLPDNKTQSGWRSASSPGGDGYNEIMFEDKKGAELLNVQAERDLHTLVKRDEEAAVGRDRTTSVKNDEDLTVGNNRTMRVQMNEREIVGLNRSRVVGVNESVEVGGTQTVTVGGAQAVTVALASAETVGLGKELTIGTAYTVTAGQTIEITCGQAKIKLESSGKITLEGTELAFHSSGPVGVVGTKVAVDGAELGLTASGKAELAGASVQISGDPVDLN
jgi:type VI secretion system secreted protein VgrG